MHVCVVFFSKILEFHFIARFSVLRRMFDSRIPDDTLRDFISLHALAYCDVVGRYLSMLSIAYFISLHALAYCDFTPDQLRRIEIKRISFHCTL